jgi:membrane peptidoglycan carboxypeptidase
MHLCSVNRAPRYGWAAAVVVAPVGSMLVSASQADSLFDNLREGRYARGASTITQQVVRNRLLGLEKTLRRKVRELILARRLERVMTKDQILTVYLDVAEWGDGIAGTEAASRRYVGKSAARLDWPEAALLAGILPSPRTRNPCVNATGAREARHSVLAKLLEYGHLTQDEFRRADDALVAARTL